MDEWRAVTAEWVGGYGFVGTNASGGRVQIGTVNDQPGIGPMEMLLLGVAGCTGMDIVSILEKERQKLTGLQVIVSGKKREEYPQIYTNIEIVYMIWGDDISVSSVERAIKLSEDKYCSASAMLAAAAQIHSRYEINQAIVSVS